MFKLVAAFIGLSMVTADDHGNFIENDIYPKYYIGTFNGNPFPLSIGHCLPVDIFGQSGYQLATCIDEYNLQWELFGDDECAGVSTVEIINRTDDDEHDGHEGDFQCDTDATDSYAEIEFSAFTCETETKVVMRAAIGQCAYLEDDEISIQVGCEPGFATLTYSDDDGCLEDEIYNIANASLECGFMLKTNGVKVYGLILEDGCVNYNASVPATTDDSKKDDSANGQFSLMAFIVAGIFALLVKF